MFNREITDFNLINTFENGQCFRFEPYDGGYLGIVQGKVIYLRQTERGIEVDGVTESEFDSIFCEYFDLKTDYNKIAQTFPQEENLLNAIMYGNGMKILRQDTWEALISFIISQNNNITRIKNIIKRMSQQYGSPIYYQGNTFYTFPNAKQLSRATEADFSALGCGYRSAYLHSTVEKVNSGEFALEELKECGYTLAKEKLLTLKGVGSKVADCILLFGLGYTQAFPVDTWVKKVMEVLYLKKPSTKEQILDYASTNFGEYAGLAQQYLFYYARENKIKGLE